MESENEISKSPEEILAGKKSELLKKIDLMLDWQLAERIKESIQPQIDSFTSEELDYLLEKVENLDSGIQSRGPLAASVDKFKEDSEDTLAELGANIDPDRIKQLDQLFEL